MNKKEHWQFLEEKLSNDEYYFDVSEETKELTERLAQRYVPKGVQRLKYGVITPLGINLPPFPKRLKE